MNVQREQEESAKAEALATEGQASARSEPEPSEADCARLQGEIEKLLAEYDAAVLELYRLDREHESIDARRDTALAMLRECASSRLSSDSSHSASNCLRGPRGL